MRGAILRRVACQSDNGMLAHSRFTVTELRSMVFRTLVIVAGGLCATALVRGGYASGHHADESFTSLVNPPTIPETGHQRFKTILVRWRVFPKGFA